MRRLPVLYIGFVLLVVAAAGTGCGEGGAASGATVSVYVAAPLCREAQGELTKVGGKAGDLEVRVVCLPEIVRGRRNDLAIAGQNARRTTEDSASVAYLEAPGGGAKFTRSIVEAANIAWLEIRSGSQGMRRVLRALEERGSSSPRSEVLDQIG
ncbi:MAG: hypothetical protein ACTHN3_03290 [Solirubrobacterales bacterium]